MNLDSYGACSQPTLNFLDPDDADDQSHQQQLNEDAGNGNLIQSYDNRSNQSANRYFDREINDQVFFMKTIYSLANEKLNFFSLSFK